MTFQKSDLLKVARLSRLSLTQEEMGKFEDDLERIITFITQLNEVNVTNIAPMSHAGDRALTLRDDVGGETLGRQCVQSSQGYEDGLVRVPKIIE